MATTEQVLEMLSEMETATGGDVYASPSEAEAAAVEYGGAGYHVHEQEGGYVYMPFDSMESYMSAMGHGFSDSPSEAPGAELPAEAFLFAEDGNNRWPAFDAGGAVDLPRLRDSIVELLQIVDSLGGHDAA